MRAHRLLIATVAAGVLIAGPLAGFALAHVEAEAPSATRGGSGPVTFSAEAEETTPLTKIEIVFPTDSPLDEVTVPPKDGWTSAVTDAGAMVGRITWTATAAGIEPGKTGEFAIQVGRFPDVAQVVFKALVTYADGTVVSWIELQAPGGPEPEHPAPVLSLAPGAAAATPAAAVVITTTPVAPSVGATGGASGGGIGAPVIAVLVVVALVVAGRRRGRVR